MTAKMKIYDGFPTKALAKRTAADMRKQGVQYVHVRPINQASGTLKYGVDLVGRKASMYV